MEEGRRDDIPSDEIMIMTDEMDVPRDEIRMDETRGQDVMEEHHEVVEEARRWPNGRPQLMNGPFRTWTKWEAEIGQLTEAKTDQSEAETGQVTEPLPREPVEPSPLALFAKLKQEHNLAKAVKSDNVEVHVDLWDQAVCKGPPLDAKRKALATIHGYIMRRYQQCLWLDARKYLQDAYGMDWVERVKGGNTKALEDTEAIYDVLWQAARNDWFKYPLGLRLIFFRFPTRYCAQAKRGVGVLYTCKGPSSRRRQPPLKPDEKAILKKKILKFVGKCYLAPPVGQIGSLIKYFAVPKGVIDNVLQDWRIVFHAGANKLNDCVWAPSFCLPTVNLLLRITDKKSLMRDHRTWAKCSCFSNCTQIRQSSPLLIWDPSSSAPRNVHIAGCVGCVISWASSLHLITPSGCIWCQRRSSKVTAMIQTTPSNGIPFLLTYQE
jgi:hypothetical protein